MSAACLAGEEQKNAMYACVAAFSSEEHLMLCADCLYDNTCMADFRLMPNTWGCNE